MAVTGVTTALAIAAWRGMGTVAWIWAGALAGDGTAIWVDRAAVGAETEARAGVGTGTGV